MTFDKKESVAADVVVTAPAEVVGAPSVLPTASSPQQSNNGFESDRADSVAHPGKSGFERWFARFRRIKTSRPDSASPLQSSEADTPAGSALSAAPEDGAISRVKDLDPVLPDGAGPATSSNEIFMEVGQQLRARREMLSLTYEEIERHTHVRAAFLSALERGALDELPSPVQTRGILVNYAGFLDLDVDSILLRFADGVQARYREKGPQKPARSKAMTVHTTLPPLRTFIASDLVFGGGLAIMLLLFAVWGISRVMTIRSETPPRATAPSISDLLVSTPLPTLVQQVTVIPAQDTPLPASQEATTATLELATLDPHIKVQVELTSSERTYLRVMVDGKIQFEGRTDIGSSYSYHAADQIEIVVGNGAALRVNYNDKDLGLMGSFGEVIDRLYTAQGVATPTSTPRPTGTPTPKVTGTPTATPTITPSVTKTP